MILENLDDLVAEAKRRNAPLNPMTSELHTAFKDTAEGKDLQAIGVFIDEIKNSAIILGRKGPMATVELFKNVSGEYCYEYTSTKEGVERYALHKFATPEECWLTVYKSAVQYVNNALSNFSIPLPFTRESGSLTPITIWEIPA